MRWGGQSRKTDNKQIRKQRGYFCTVLRSLEEIKLGNLRMWLRVLLWVRDRLFERVTLKPRFK